MSEPRIIIEEHYGIKVLRDDLLPGGTKNILLPQMIHEEIDEYVYASPVYGGFQIALSMYCKAHGKRATIFCAQRREMHPNTAVCINHGAKVVQVPHGYLTVVERAARDYCEQTGAEKLVFGAKTPDNIKRIAARMQAVTAQLGAEPREVWCAVGSGTLVEGILEGTETARINGVCVGAAYSNPHPRLCLWPYPVPFERPARFTAPFPSMPNYDLKAWEFCRFRGQDSEGTLFWNVL